MMVKLVKTAVIALIGGVALIGCGEKLSVQHTEEIRAAVANALPENWSVTDFQIEAIEDLGTKAAPKIASRFTAQATLSENLYWRRRFEPEYLPQLSYLPVPILLDKEIGENREVFGTTETVRQGEGWRTKVTFESAAFGDQGTPRDFFEGDGIRVIALGTDEERTFNEEMKDIEEAARAEEAERQRAIDAAAQAREEALKARIEAKRAEEIALERAAAEAAQIRAEAQRVALEAMKADFKAYVAGATFSGTASQNFARYDVQLTVNVEEVSGKLIGRIEWPKFNAIKSVEGEITVNKDGQAIMTLNELKLENPQEAAKEAFLGIRYVLTRDLQNDRRMYGSWSADGPARKIELVRD